MIILIYIAIYLMHTNAAINSLFNDYFIVINHMHYGYVFYLMLLCFIDFDSESFEVILGTKYPNMSLMMYDVLPYF